MAAFVPETTSTIEDFISAGRRISISYDALSYKERLSNGTEIAILNVVNDYMEEFKKLLATVQLDEKQYRKYRFKPKLLAYDLYGNPELYYIILLLNGIIDIKEFDLRIVKLLKIDHMNVLLSYIYNAEKKDIDSYNHDHDTV